MARGWKKKIEGMGQKTGVRKRLKRKKTGRKEAKGVLKHTPYVEIGSITKAEDDAPGIRKWDATRQPRFKSEGRGSLRD